MKKHLGKQCNGTRVPRFRFVEFYVFPFFYRIYVTVIFR